MSISSAAIWEVRTTGSDANGGFYVSGGTDYSQQDAAQLSVTDGVTNGTTTVTSATGGFTAAMIGNGINIAGTIRQITAVASSTSITVDATVAAASGQTMKVGGALASIGKAGAAQAQTNISGGNTVYIRGSFTLVTSTANTSGGPVTPTFPFGFNWNWIGYSSVRGDNGKATISCGSVTGITVFNFGNNTSLNTIRNLILDGNSGASNRGMDATSRNHVAIDCEFKNFTNIGFYANGVGRAVRCKATGCSTQPAFSGGVCQFCTATGNSGAGFGNTGTYINCLSYGNTTTNGHGFTSNGNTGPLCCYSCTAYGNGGNGFYSQAEAAFYVNCLSVGNTGNGFLNSLYQGQLVSHCAAYNNVAGNFSFSSGPTESLITLTGDPFTNAASGDFSLNNTAGAGAACRAAGIPGAFPGGTTTGYQDVGAVQSSGSGGGGNTIVIDD